MRICLLAALAGLAAGAGCGGDSGLLSPETEEADYREAQQLKNQGRTDEALAAYLKVIAKRGDQAPESFLDAGIIYLERSKDPIAAIYYFRRYLEVQPNSRQSAYVRGLIFTAEREFARTLPAQPLENQAPHLDMLDQVDRLRRENESLKAELDAIRGAAGALVPHAAGSGAPLFVTAPQPPVPAADSPPITEAPLAADDEPALAAQNTGSGRAQSARPPPQPAAGTRTHTVAKGDTLFSLSQRYYGSRSRWRDILAANRDQLPGEGATLRIGMVLKIP